MTGPAARRSLAGAASATDLALVLAPVRLETVHPALVHFTLGAVPVFLVAYLVAVRRRSERWSFAGDVALWVGAALTVATAAFGLVSNAMVPWPGGLGRWRWLHLGLAIAATLVLLALAAARVAAARRGIRAGGKTLAAATLAALLLGATGWVGGEVLVFHAGMAVSAAGQGALAPTISREGGDPGSVEDAMARLRGAWAAARTTFDGMLVERPDAAGYARLADAAQYLAGTSEWLEREGPAALERHEREHEGEHGEHEHGGAGTTAEELRRRIAQMAGELHGHARDLERAARAERWDDASRALAEVTRSCSACHQELRWRR